MRKIEGEGEPGMEPRPPVAIWPWSWRPCMSSIMHSTALSLSAFWIVLTSQTGRESSTVHNGAHGHQDHGHVAMSGRGSAPGSLF